MHDTDAIHLTHLIWKVGGDWLIQVIMGYNKQHTFNRPSGYYKQTTNTKTGSLSPLETITNNKNTIIFMLIFHLVTYKYRMYGIYSTMNVLD